MLYSMTGFGRGEAPIDSGRIQVSVRTVNHKGLDVRLHCPAALSPFEPALVGQVRKMLGRGRVDVSFDFEGTAASAVSINARVISEVYASLSDLAQSLGIQEPVTMADVLRAPDVWRTQPNEDPGLGDAAAAALGEALGALNAARVTEGEALKRDLNSHLDTFEGCLSAAREQAPKRLTAYRERLVSRIAELTAGTIELDEQRVAAEVALFADRADISEEMVRALAHVCELRQLINAERDGTTRVGKRLDFFCQELGREVNTTSAKSRDTTLTQIAIDMRSVMESMREQVANIQ